MVTGIAVDSRRVLVIPTWVDHANARIFDVLRYNKVIEVVHWVAKEDSKFLTCDVQHYHQISVIV